MSEQRSATVAIVGRPNAGKSTLLNALVGHKLAITSHKPQATRMPVVGLLTTGDTQLVLVDQPGLMDPGYPLQEVMRAAAVGWVRRSDAILYLHPAHGGPPPALESIVPELESIDPPVALVRTMADRHPPPQESPNSPGGGPTFWVSAVTGVGLAALVEWCRANAPVRPFRYEEDELSTQPQRFFVTEFVREAAFEHLGQELPYALAAEVDEFREGSDPLYIRVTIFVERESQKPMVIGKNGRTIKALGADARRKIEELLGERVYLDLWVKILPKWRSKPSALVRFGFSPLENSR
jgi:GTP-binding protein Era